jgi:hypothetical protein
MAAKIAMRCSQRIREIMAMGQGNERLVDCINNGTEVARSAIAGVTYSPAIVIGPANHPVAVEPLFLLGRREPDASAVRHVSVLCTVGRGSVVQTSSFCVSVQCLCLWPRSDGCLRCWRWRKGALRPAGQHDIICNGWETAEPILVGADDFLTRWRD